jgi:hypothetical protein
MKTSPLNNIKIASPCSANWDEMVGDERKKFCGECNLNVYNLSGMTKGEAENLLLESDGRLCVRFFKRADGTILTQDCPVGWAKVKRNLSRVATAAFALVFGTLGGIFAFNSAKENDNHTTGMVSPANVKIEEDPEYCPPATMGNVATMGTPMPINELPLAGRVSNPKEIQKQIRKNRNY